MEKGKDMIKNLLLMRNIKRNGIFLCGKIRVKFI